MHFKDLRKRVEAAPKRDYLVSLASQPELLALLDRVDELEKLVAVQSHTRVPDICALSRMVIDLENKCTSSNWTTDDHALLRTTCYKLDYVLKEAGF